MTKVEAIIQVCKVETVKTALHEIGIEAVLEAALARLVTERFFSREWMK